LSLGGIIEPDTGFIAELKNSGSESLKKCFQCSHCTSICGVSEGGMPFPRREMVLAQWGQREKLIYSPGVWICHQCGDCTEHCPRGADPSEILQAVRNMSYREFATPSFLAEMLSNRSMLVPLLAVPVAVVLLVVMAVNGLSIPEGEIVFSKMMPIAVIDSLFIPVALFAVITALMGIKRFWNGMSEHYPREGKPNVLSGLVKTVTDILLHRQFGKCEKNRGLQLSHLLTFFGFMALFVTTNMVMLYHYVFEKETPLDLLDPVKILGNAGAIAAFIGVLWIIYRRIAIQKEAGKPTYFDWTFLIVLFLTIVTGIGAESARLAGLALVAYSVYFTHLVLVFFLFAYMPFSKFAHIIYRTTAMVFANGMEKPKQT
jgi:quinone-modifying oxidoreductase subunit QmoC